jgi:hypothetical protein
MHATLRPPPACSSQRLDHAAAASRARSSQPGRSRIGHREHRADRSRRVSPRASAGGCRVSTVCGRLASSPAAARVDSLLRLVSFRPWGETKRRFLCQETRARARTTPTTRHRAPCTLSTQPRVRQLHSWLGPHCERTPASTESTLELERNIERHCAMQLQPTAASSWVLHSTQPTTLYLKPFFRSSSVSKPSHTSWSSER